MLANIFQLYQWLETETEENHKKNMVIYEKVSVTGLLHNHLPFISDGSRGVFGCNPRNV